MSPVLKLFIWTGIVSIVVSFLIIHWSRLTGQARVAENKKVTATDESETGLADVSGLKNTIFTEVKEVVDSMEQCREISSRLVNVVGKELQKRIDEVNQELSRKYENIIDEKTKNEEIAWDKYNKVLVDKKQTDAVIRSIAEGLVVVDAQGKVVMLNPAAEKLLGVSKKEKIGKSVLDNLKEEQLVSFSRSQPNKEGKEIELVSQQDETKKILRASTAVIESENGQTVGMVSVLSDITKQKELDRLKSTFVANVSHELRTPLVAIDKSLSLILGKTAGEVTETQEQFLSIAQRNLKRLSSLVNDLLDLSKLEAGRMELKKEPISIVKVIEEAVIGLENWAKTKSITVETVIQKGLPEASIDPDRILQVLNNLIGNAIKFTPANGKITVSAKLSDESGKMEVCIADTGIGIAPTDLPKIFDKFYQSGERVSTDINGTGIGLSIAKEIVELHLGRIWAESPQGSGAKFCFTLPIKS